MSEFTFEGLRLSAPVLKALAECGYTQPTPIQEQAIPPAMAGKDLIGTAQTGTGKTAAFALPIIERLARRDPSRLGTIGAVILTPTRELALQIEENLVAYTRHLPLRTVVILGGVSSEPQVRKLREGVDMVVATPGRMIDLCEQGHVRLEHLEVFVLDEADRMLDMGFVQDVRLVVDRLPKQRQTMMFSTTMSPRIASLGSTMLHNPYSVSVAPPATVADNIDQRVMFVEKANKRELLADLLHKAETERTLVFTRTRHSATRLARQLEQRGIRADAIHSDRTQGQRQRVLAAFAAGRLPVLVATDIVARGIDVEGITHVVNFELPEDPENYVHRIGRTARAGKAGVAVSLCDIEDISLLRGIENLTRIPLTVHEDHRWHAPGVAACRDAAQRAARGKARAGGGRSSGSKWAR
ncbi:MAG TPA: DEAD/DEAH box helicase [Candidatus Krumholzibacteria bacterium]|nr:DEAD/DEAH box helicase [Candidatus Krumholzibacteria bacterium]